MFGIIITFLTQIICGIFRECWFVASGTKKAKGTGKIWTLEMLCMFIVEYERNFPLERVIVSNIYFQFTSFSVYSELCEWECKISIYLHVCNLVIMISTIQIKGWQIFKNKIFFELFKTLSLIGDIPASIDCRIESSLCWEWKKIQFFQLWIKKLRNADKSG